MQGIISPPNGMSQVLSQLHRARKSGSLMVKTEAKLIQASFQDGKLTAVSCRNLKGKLALEILLQVRDGEYNFLEGWELKKPPQDDLPDLSMVLG